MKQRYERIFAVDPSLTCSGWALFRLPQARLIAVGKVRSLPSTMPISERLLDLQYKICRVFDSVRFGPGDVLVCEAPTTMRDPRAAFKVEQVRGIFETVARERSGLVPGRINPRSVQHEIMGMAGVQQVRAEVKRTAVSVVRALFSADLQTLGFPCEVKELGRHQDIVDAILVGSLAANRVNTAQTTGVALPALFEESSRRFSRKGLRQLHCA